MNRIVADELRRKKLGLHDAICLTDPFVFTPGDCLNFKAIRYESISLNRIVADELHRKTLGLHDAICLTDPFVFTPGHCLNFKEMRYKSVSLNGVLADRSSLCNPVPSPNL